GRRSRATASRRAFEAAGSEPSSTRARVVERHSGRPGRGMSEPQIDSVAQVRARGRRRGDFGDAIQPGVLSPELVSREVPVSGRPVDVLAAAAAELGQLGVDGAKAGFWPAVFGVPVWALVDLGAPLVE